MVRISWTTRAVSDLENIFQFISQDSKYYAKRHVSKIKIRTESLKEHINLGRIVPEFSNPKVIELIEGR